MKSQWAHCFDDSDIEVASSSLSARSAKRFRRYVEKMPPKDSMVAGKVSRIIVPGFESAASLVKILRQLGYFEIAEGEELRPGFYQFCSVQSETDMQRYSVTFIELPEDHGLTEKLLIEFQSPDSTGDIL
jgi:hypothetical protein